MRLLLDQGLPRSAAALLTELGFDTVHAGEIGLAAASDVAIIDRARLDGRTIVTLDADFHALIALTGASSPSVIRIREEGLRGAEMAELVARTVALARTSWLPARSSRCGTGPSEFEPPRPQPISVGLSLSPGPNPVRSMVDVGLPRGYVSSSADRPALRGYPAFRPAPEITEAA